MHFTNMNLKNIILLFDFVSYKRECFFDIFITVIFIVDIRKLLK